MGFLTMRHDFRAPIDGSSTLAEIYTAAMEQFRWADEHGFDFGVISEHHGFDDGWMPAPMTAAAAVVGATKRLPILLSAVILPLHDPIRTAEQLVVLDHLSRGRVWTVLGAGYRPDEFSMAGVEMKRRGATLESHIEVMLQAFTGEPFEFWGWTCGVLLARAHARTGDIAKIAGYIGKSDAFAAALAEFAEAYGDQTERDHAALVEAVRMGQVAAIHEDDR